MQTGLALLLAFVFLFAAGCRSGLNAFPADKAILNDLAVPAALDSGFRVAQVDGQAAQRARSAVITVVPYVLIEPGERRLQLEPRSGQDLPPTAITGMFEAGKRYRLKRDGDVVTFVKDKN